MSVKNSLIPLLLMMLTASSAMSKSALEVLGKDYKFKNKISGLPSKLSDIKNLQINNFTTSDGINLSYWEAGTGEPLIFSPPWAGSGAEYINLIYLLSKKYHVFVIDYRNSGLSQKTASGMRISRFAADLKEFIEHTGVKSIYLCGWSMGASVVYSYIDLFGSQKIKKLVLIDEPVSIASRSDWSKEKKQNMASLGDTVEEVVDYFQGKPGIENKTISELNKRYQLMDSMAYENSSLFAREFIKFDPAYASLIMFDHVSQNWEDVISGKINVPTAIFTGEYSANVKSQEWMHKVIKNSKLYIYNKSEFGDHFLAVKNPFKFTKDLNDFF